MTRRNSQLGTLKLDEDQVQIVRAVPADDMQVVSTVELPHRASELYLRGDTLVALGGDYGSWNGSGSTSVTILDIIERSLPSVVATVDVEGSLVTSRLIGPKLHLVVSFRPEFPLGDRGLPVLLNNVHAMIPNITVTPTGGEGEIRNIVDWDDLYHPIDPDGYQITAVVTLDIDEPGEPRKSVGIVADAGIIYVSPEAVYLTDTDYNALGRIRETTDIYKFDLTEDGAVSAAAASVPGRVLNRFSLGEHKGHLRMATTVGNVWSFGEDRATNNVYVLGEEEEGLAVVGRVEGVAPGEKIYAARFLGDRGFLVTFKKVDPLFTLDLSDPTSPRVIGELKVPGYSDYIHPLGENHLLTIGKDAVDVGEFAWYQGVQISVFNVTDFSDPRLVDAEVIGDRGTESEALHNPHAFNYFPPAEMLAVPMTIAEDAGPEPSSRGVPVFEGLCLFSANPQDGVELIRTIATTPSEVLPEWGYWSGSGWIRGIFIAGHVYAVTSSSVQALPLAEVSATPRRLPLD